MARGTNLALAALLAATVSVAQRDTANGSGDEGGNTANPLTPLLISIISLIAVFAIVIVVLTLAIVIMCRRPASRRVHIRSKETNTYRAFSQERTQSPPESTVIIHDPLSRPSSTRSSRSHSHLLTTSPLSPLSPSPLTTGGVVTAAAAARHPRSLSTSALDSTHTYNHLRQHEGMEPLPLNYPQHEYSRLGPRSETPPLRPPKPTHLCQDAALQDVDHRPNSDPPVSATNPDPLSRVHESSAAGHHMSHVGEEARVSQRGSVQSTERDDNSSRGGGERGSSSDEVFVRRSIYDTMTSEGLRTEGSEQRSALHSSTSEARSSRDYDKLAQQPTPPSPSVTVPTSHGSRKQQKSSVKIFDDPTYSPPHSGRNPSSSSSSSSRVRSSSVKVVDPRYVGDYERHPDFVPPQVEIPRDQLLEKYRGDYERDPNYFSRNPTRSFSVSAASSSSVVQGTASSEQRSSLTLVSAPTPAVAEVTDKYRGDYERSEDYIIPPHPTLPQQQQPVQNGGGGNRTDDYVLEPDPSYAGEYERHPDYVPPLVKRSSKTRIQILATDPVSNGTVSSPVSESRPSHMPHEYTSLAAATKDPPRQYATLNSDLSMATTRTLPAGLVQDSRV